MRTLTLSVSDETLCIARVWTAGRNISQYTIAEQSLCTLPTIPRAINAFQISTLNNSRSKPQNITFLTHSFSSTSPLRISSKPPFQK